jgi:hypothetical protein
LIAPYIYTQEIAEKWPNTQKKSSIMIYIGTSDCKYSHPIFVCMHHGNKKIDGMTLLPFNYSWLSKVAEMSYSFMRGISLKNAI